jgi:sensor c-di-GMP phosphodiesterase-like protein
MQIGYGVTLHRGSPDAANDAGPVLADVHFDADGVPATLRIHGLRSRFFDTWTGLLQQSMPIAVVLSGLLAWLCYQRLIRRASWREQLLGAIRANEFHVVYQPVYSVAEQRCDGVEALLRWDRPDSGPVSPDVFIEEAERAQVVVPLTLHLLTLIAADVRHWNMPPGFHVAVNFAAEHLSDERFLGDLQPFMAEVANRQCRVVVEVTERTLMKNTPQARLNLDTLRAQGGRVAIDDFGTGYCSLSYLETFPFDLLKVDRGFVMTIDPERGEAIVLDAIISLAHQLKARVVAEGVDNPAQFDYLLTRNVSYMQGFTYAQPMPSAALLAWFARFGQRPFAFGDEAKRESDGTVGQA